MARVDPSLEDGARATPEQRAAHAAQFQRVFEAMMRDWVRGERVVEGAESWSDFKSRVIDGFEGIVADHPQGARIAVVSSGGAIAVVLGHVLGLEDLTILELNWTMRNCAVSEILYNREKRSLSTYNCTAHLEPDLLTYR
jgi:broad specificity phosphatase PhoE